MTSLSPRPPAATTISPASRSVAALMISAASDCGDPSVATTTCISGVPPGGGLGIAAPGALRPVPRAGGVLDEEQDDADADERGAPDQRGGVVVDGEPEDGEVADQPDDQQGRVGPEGAFVLVPPAQLEAGDDHECVDGQEED